MMTEDKPISSLLFDETPQVVFIINDKFELIDCNAAAIHYLGFATKEDTLLNLKSILENSVYHSGERSSFNLAQHMDYTVKHGSNEFGITLLVKGNFLPLWVIMKRVPRGDSFAIAIFAQDLRRSTVAKDDLVMQNKLYEIIHEHITFLETAEGKSFDKAVINFLGALGECIKVNRCTVWENYTENDGRFCCRQLHEWVKDAVPTMGWAITERTVYDDIPDLRDILIKDKILNDLVRNRPKYEQEYLGGQGIKSLLVIPIFIKGKFWGWMDFEDCAKERFFTDEEEKVLHFAGVLLGTTILRNITTAEFTAELEKALALKQAHLDTIAQISKLTYWEYDRITHKLTFSYHFTDEFGWTMEEIRSLGDFNLAHDTPSTWADLVHPEDRLHTRREMDLYAADITKRFRCEMRMRHKDGHYLWTLVSGHIAAVTQSDDSKLPLVIGGLLNINDIKEAESSNSAKSQFLASMSHEIRTPMNAIIGMSELIRTDNFDAMQKNYFSDIRKMSKTLLGIINDILDISKIEAGKMELVPIHFDLEEVFDTICSMNKFTAAAKSLIFNCHLADDVPRILYGDEMRIRQVITNLVSNAIKYTREGSVSLSITRAVRNGRDCVVIAVEDTGIGIRKEDIPKLFDNFQQLDSRRNRGIVGTGLGLAIVKNIVDLMGGGVEVTSAYRKGSVFTAWLPFTKGDPEQIKREPDISKIIASGDTRVLVVDDNSINITVALGFLATHNIQADTAISGMEAIEKIKSNYYDIVFMDHMMPEMDGTEASMLIRSLDGGRFQTLPIIALSANAVFGVRELFLKSGMNDFLAKPIEADELNHILKRWLPPEKIMETKVSEIDGTSTRESGDFAPVLKALSEIPELDTGLGLSHIGGNVPAYIGILKQFCIEFDGFIEEIRRFKDREDWKEYGIRLHAIKGMFASIGVESLRAWAYKLELASKNNETQVCRNETEAISNAMIQFRDKLLKTPVAAVEAKKEKHKVSAETLSEKLYALKKACARGDSGAAESIACELETAHFGYETDAILTRIIAAVASLDYDDVIADIDAICRAYKLQSPPEGL